MIWVNKRKPGIGHAVHARFLTVLMTLILVFSFSEIISFASESTAISETDAESEESQTETETETEISETDSSVAENTDAEETQPQQPEASETPKEEETNPSIEEDVFTEESETLQPDISDTDALEEEQEEAETGLTSEDGADENRAEEENDSDGEPEEKGKSAEIEKSAAKEEKKSYGTDNGLLDSVMESMENPYAIVGFSLDIYAYPPADVSENTKLIYKYLTEELGMNHAAACGILANIQLESGFSQFALGDGGTSYGICQWHNERFNRLIWFCNTTGADYNTLEGQLSYLSYELRDGYTGVLNYLMSVPNTAQGAYDSAYFWCMYFEAPSEAQARSAQRGNLAKYEYFPLDLSLGETGK